jgi:hypothetical protein
MQMDKTIEFMKEILDAIEPKCFCSDIFVDCKIRVSILHVVKIIAIEIIEIYV